MLPYRYTKGRDWRGSSLGLVRDGGLSSHPPTRAVDRCRAILSRDEFSQSDQKPGDKVLIVE